MLLKFIVTCYLCKDNRNGVCCINVIKLTDPLITLTLRKAPVQPSSRGTFFLKKNFPASISDMDLFVWIK